MEAASASETVEVPLVSILSSAIVFAFSTETTSTETDWVTAAPPNSTFWSFLGSPLLPCVVTVTEREITCDSFFNTRTISAKSACTNLPISEASRVVSVLRLPRIRRPASSTSPCGGTSKRLSAATQGSTSPNNASAALASRSYSATKSTTTRARVGAAIGTLADGAAVGCAVAFCGAALAVAEGEGASAAAASEAAKSVGISMGET